MPLLALGAAGAAPLAAQSLTAGSLAGEVQDETGLVLGEADVALTDRATGVIQTLVTRRDGAFRFLLIPPGDYELRVERIGYRPQVIPRVPVRASGTLQAIVRLRPAGAGDPMVDTVALGAAPAGGVALVLSGAALDFADLAEAGGWLGSAAALLPPASAGLEMEGMPGRMAALAFDGMSRRAARHPRGDGPFETMIAPLVMVGSAEFGGGLDAEWPGFAGGLLAGTTQRGAARLTLDAQADAGTASQRGHLVLRGPVVRDTAHFTLGVAFRRLTPELGAPLAAGPVADSIVAVARDSFDTDLAAYLRPLQPTLTIGTGFGRFDWRLTARHHLVLRAAASAGSVDDPDLGAAWSPVPGSALSLWELTTGLALTSQLGSRVAQEMRFGVDAGNRDFTGGTMPRVAVAEAGTGFGGGDALPGRFRRITVHGSETLHLRTGSSEIKLGLGLRSTRFDQTFAEDRGGVYLFGGWSEMARREGAFRRTSGTVPVTTFRTTEMAFYLQTLTRPSPGLELMTGLRWQRESVPVDAARRDNTWLARTGLDNAALVRPAAFVSPRASFQWSTGRQREWQVRGEAALVRDRFDAGLLAEWMGRSLGATVARSAGTLGTWPDIPDSQAVNQGSLLTLFGPQFEPPRTGRAGLAFTRAFGGTIVRLSGSYRHTDFLPRRRDLNLTAAPSARDGDGRAVYGSLAQYGGLVVAAPGSNRRFAGFDAVEALDATGASDHYGITFGIERLVDAGLSLLASYTYSRTTDNWTGAAGGTAEAQLLPFDSVAGQVWARGTSDFDIPHRLTVGAQVGGGRFGMRLGTLVRWQSGMPFTPGYRDGVDVNGDGSGRNDPAFVSDTIGATADVIAAHSCLAAQVGRFAERNSCRAPSELRVDLRFGVRLFRTASGGTTELLVDGLDLAGSEVGVVDRALYLVDPSRTVSTDAAGRVRVPLIENPGFGRILQQRSPGATWRVSVRVTW